MVEARSDWSGTVRSDKKSNGKRGESANSRGHIPRLQSQAQRSAATTAMESAVLELVCTATAGAVTQPPTRYTRERTPINLPLRKPVWSLLLVLGVRFGDDLQWP